MQTKQKGPRLKITSNMAKANLKKCINGGMTLLKPGIPTTTLASREERWATETEESLRQTFEGGQQADKFKQPSGHSTPRVQWTRATDPDPPGAIIVRTLTRVDYLRQLLTTVQSADDTPQQERRTMRHPTRVFLQYTHDSRAHKDRVRQLADRLRGDGLDATVDQYVENPPEGWIVWMDSQLQHSDYVLVLCSEPNYRRFHKQEKPGAGLGATWEGHLVQQHLYDAGVTNRRFIPVLFEENDKRFIPRALKAVTHYYLCEPDGYERLFRRLTNQPATEVPPIGRLRRMRAPSRRRK